MRTALGLGVAAVALGLAGAWGTGCASSGSSSTLAGGVAGGSTDSTTTTTTTTTGTTTSSSSTTGPGGGGAGGSAATTSTSTGSGGGTGGAGTGGAGGMPNPGLPLGADCNLDTDCASMLCKPVVIDSAPVCVTPCAQQSDCPASGPGATYFCEAVTAGSSMGYCIPHSPAHCLSCTKDSDCGSLSEVCFQAPGDNALACNVDCALGGASACPPDYTCTAETVNGMARQLCRPNLISVCLQATGGYCDRLSVPQPCIVTNAAGMCIGQRTCMQGNDRFSSCGATAPQCKADCMDQDPMGCMESFCASATSGVTNCGVCGNVCPGYMQSNDNVTCDATQKCTFSCQGENYDVDINRMTGCEVPDSPQGNHTQSSAASEGNVSDCDSGGTDFTFTGQLPSDKRVHEMPSVVGFDANSGSAPDWYSIVGVGHTFCANDLVVQFSVQGSSSPTCYKMTVITDTHVYSCQVNASGSCPNQGPAGQSWGIYQNGGGQFSDDTTIYFEVQKTCSTAVVENVSYTISGHL